VEEIELVTVQPYHFKGVVVVVVVVVVDEAARE
jgi:hypothetical protein